MAHYSIDTAAGGGSLYPRLRGDTKDALLWELINSQRVFSEQVKKALSASQGKCSPLVISAEEYQGEDDKNDAVHCVSNSLNKSFDTKFTEGDLVINYRTHDGHSEMNSGSIESVNINNEPCSLISDDTHEKTKLLGTNDQDMKRDCDVKSFTAEESLTESIEPAEVFEMKELESDSCPFCIANSSHTGDSTTTVHDKKRIHAIIQCSVNMSNKTTQTNSEASTIDNAATLAKKNSTDRKSNTDLKCSLNSEVSEYEKPVEVIETFNTSCINPYPCCSSSCCLYNYPGKLCTVLGIKFILTHIKNAPVLIELKKDIQSEPPGRYSILWMEKKPVLLSDFEDGMQVYFDAVVFPDSSKFTCLVVWQGEKPKISVEPSFGTYVFVCELKEILGRLEYYENGIGYVTALLNGKKETFKFLKQSFYINGNKASKNDITKLLASQDLEVVMDVFKFAAIYTDNLTRYELLCSCVWKGSKPIGNSLKIDPYPDPYTLYKIEMCTLFPCQTQIQLYTDVEASIHYSNTSYHLQFKIDNETISLPCNSIGGYGKEKIHTMGEHLRAHVYREKWNSKFVYKVAMLQPYETKQHKIESPIENVNTSSLSLVEASEGDAFVKKEMDREKKLNSEESQEKASERNSIKMKSPEQKPKESSIVMKEEEREKLKGRKEGEKQEEAHEKLTAIQKESQEEKFENKLVLSTKKKNMEEHREEDGIEMKKPKNVEREKMKALKMRNERENFEKLCKVVKSDIKQVEKELSEGNKSGAVQEEAIENNRKTKKNPDEMISKMKEEKKDENDELEKRKTGEIEEQTQKTEKNIKKMHEKLKEISQLAKEEKREVKHMEQKGKMDEKQLEINIGIEQKNIIAAKFHENLKEGEKKGKSSGELSLAEMKPKTFTFQSTLLQIKSTKEKPELLMNQSGRLEWNPEHQVFRVCTTLRSGEIRFSVGPSVCYLSNCNFVYGKKTTVPEPVMFDAYYTGIPMCSYRLLAMWKTEKPPAARNNEYLYLYEVPCIILRIFEDVLDLHIYTEILKDNIIRLSVPQNIYTSNGDRYTGTLFGGALVRAHLKVSSSSTEKIKPKILLMVIMTKDGKPLNPREDLIKNMSNVNMKNFDDNLNAFVYNKNWFGTQALLCHLSTIKFEHYNTKKDLPRYLQSFVGIIVEKEEIGKAILCMLGTETVIIHFQKVAYVCSEESAVQVNEVPNETIVQFDAYQFKANDSQYTAIFVWTGQKRIDGIEYADGTTYLYYVSGKYIGMSSNVCEYELELDGTKHFTCIKSNNVILPDGNNGDYPLPGSSVNVHLKQKGADGDMKGITLFVFTGGESHRKNILESTKDCSTTLKQKTTLPNMSLEGSSEYCWCIYGGTAKLVSLKDGTRSLIVSPDSKSLIDLNEIKQVFIHGCMKNVSDVERNTIVSFDAIPKNSKKNFCYKPILLWIGEKPRNVELPDAKYAFDVEGNYLGMSDRGKITLSLNVEGISKNYTVEKSGYIYFPDGTKAINELEIGHSVKVHLKFKKMGGTERVILLFMIVKSDKHKAKPLLSTFNTTDPPEEKKLIVKVNVQINNQKNMSLSKMGVDVTHEKFKKSANPYLVFEGKLQFLNRQPSKYIFYYENSEKSVSLPSDFVVEDNMKSVHFPFYMIMYSEKRNLTPLCGWTKKAFQTVHLQYNLLFHSFDKVRKLITLKDEVSAKYIKYTYQEPFIYMRKTKCSFEEFAQTNPPPPLHILREDIIPHILFLTTNISLATKVLKYFAISEVDFGFQLSQTLTGNESLRENFQSASEVQITDIPPLFKDLLQDDALKYKKNEPSLSKDGHHQCEVQSLSNIIKGDELKAKIKNTNLQNCVIFKGLYTNFGVFSCCYKNKLKYFTIPKELFREGIVEVGNNDWYVLIYKDPSNEELLHPLAGWHGILQGNICVLTNQRIVSIDPNVGLVGLCGEDEEFHQIYYYDQRFYFSDMAQKLPIQDLLPSSGILKNINVVVESISTRELHGYLIDKNILFMSKQLHLTLACAKMYIQCQDEFSEQTNSLAVKEPMAGLSASSETVTLNSERDVNYEKFMIYPKDITSITYGTFNLFAVREDFAVLRTKTNTAVACQKQFFLNDKRIDADVPLNNVVKEGECVGAYVTEMEEPIMVKGKDWHIYITEIALIAFVGKKPKQASDIISEWKQIPEKVLFLPGTRIESGQGKSYADATGTQSKFVPKTKTIPSSSPLKTVHARHNKADAELEFPKLASAMTEEPEPVVQKQATRTAPPDNCMTKGKILKVQKLWGVLERSNGSSCKFKPDQVWMFGLCLQGKYLSDVLCAGIEVDYEMCDDFLDVKGIWVGDTSYEPSILYSKVEQWCKEHYVPRDITDDLLCETGWLPDDLEPVFDLDLSKEIVDVETVAWQKAKKNKHK